MMVEAVESIQLALFLRDPPTSDALELWDRAVGGKPTGFNTIAPGNTQARGNFAGADLNVIVQQARVDLILQGMPPAPSLSPVPDPPILGDPDGSRLRALDAIKRILPQLVVSRTAAVIQGHTLAADALDAAAKLRKLLPKVPFPDRAQDIIYQIIVPRTSAIAQRQLKQLCRWQTLNMQFIQMPLGGLQVPQMTTQRFAVHLYVDIFSEAIETLDSDQALASLNDVVTAAVNLLRGGYDAL
jgi:hypothetical protein